MCRLTMTMPTRGPRRLGPRGPLPRGPRLHRGSRPNAPAAVEALTAAAAATWDAGRLLQHPAPRAQFREAPLSLRPQLLAVPQRGAPS